LQTRHSSSRTQVLEVHYWLL